MAPKIALSSIIGRSPPFYGPSEITLLAALFCPKIFAQDFEHEHSSSLKELTLQREPLWYLFAKSFFVPCIAGGSILCF